MSLVQQRDSILTKSENNLTVREESSEDRKFENDNISEDLVSEKMQIFVRQAYYGDIDTINTTFILIYCTVYHITAF